MVLSLLHSHREHSRVVVHGHRVDDGDRCTVVVAHECTGEWAIYPHGGSKFGVRLPIAEALTLARAIIAAHS
ncbi:MAG: hypothetical protein ACRDRW_19585 [Pseudonocardiaceae bacterium]